MFLLENFWKLLLITVVAIAGYFTWARYDQEKERERLARNLAVFFDPTVYTSRSEPESFGEAFLQVIAEAHRTSTLERKKGEDSPLKQIIFRATEINGLETEYAKVAHRSIQASLNVCREFDVFSDGGSNLDLMDVGEPPIILNGPYEGEQLIPCAILSPLIAREGYNQLINTTLVPEPVRTLNAFALTTLSSNSATTMARAGVMTDDRVDRIKRLYRSYRQKAVAEIKDNL